MYKGREVYIKSNCPDSKYHYQHGQISNKRGNHVTVLFSSTRPNGQTRWYTARFHKAYIAIKE